MSTEQHEALKHAALLNAEAWPAHMTLHKWADIAGSTIRTQHALIVQMADCMKLLRNHTSVNSHQIALIDESLVPATQYLKGPKT